MAMVVRSKKQSDGVLHDKNSPSWRLSFRMDEQPPRSSLADEVGWEHQRDFYISVIDPPPQTNPRPTTPFFASDLACQIANLLVGRPFREQLSDKSFEGKSVAAIGKDCLAAGLVVAMLGARVALVCGRELLQAVRENVRLFLKGTFDFTKRKSECVTAICVEPTSSFTGVGICEQLSSSSLDVVVMTESCATAMVGRASSGRGSGRSPQFGWAADSGEFLSFQLPQHSDELGHPILSDMLADLSQPGELTKLLIVCDGKAALPPSPRLHAKKPLVHGQEGSSLPFGLDESAEWCARPFCILLERFPVILAERHDAKTPFSSKTAPPLHSCLVPVGRLMAGCGLAGRSNPKRTHRIFLNDRLLTTNTQLKESLVLHNRWKQNEAIATLEEARSWAEWRFTPGSPSEEMYEMTINGCMPSPSSSVKALSASMQSTAELPAAGSQERVSLMKSVYFPRQHRRKARPFDPQMSVGETTTAGSSALRVQSTRLSQRTQFNSVGSLLREVPIVERHKRPPYWYRCNRPVYGPEH